MFQLKSVSDTSVHSYVRTYRSVCTYVFTCVFFIPSVAPSVIKVKATPDTDVPSERYDYTIVCIIDPDSTADTCEVTVRSGEMTMISM